MNNKNSSHQKKSSRGYQNNQVIEDQNNINKYKGSRQLSQKYKQQEQYQQYPSIQTPRNNRAHKSTSLYPNNTSSKYIQLKLQLSYLKRENTQKLLIQKDRRIIQLQSQIKQNQQLVHETIKKYKQFIKNNKVYENNYHIIKSKDKQIEQITNKFKDIKQENEKYKIQRQNRQLIMAQNNKVKQENSRLIKQNQELKNKYNQLKLTRKKQKQQWRQILPEFIEQFNQLKKDFININIYKQ